MEVSKAPTKSAKLATDEAAIALTELAAEHGNKNELLDRLVLWCRRQTLDGQRLILGKLSERIREQVIDEIKWD